MNYFRCCAKTCGLCLGGAASDAKKAYGVTENGEHRRDEKPSSLANEDSNPAEKSTSATDNATSKAGEYQTGSKPGFRAVPRPSTAPSARASDGNSTNSKDESAARSDDSGVPAAPSPDGSYAGTRGTELKRTGGDSGGLEGGVGMGQPPLPLTSTTAGLLSLQSTTHVFFDLDR